MSKTIKSRKRNHYKERLSCTCDECGREPDNKILWMDKYRYLWCQNCWSDNKV